MRHHAKNEQQVRVGQANFAYKKSRTRHSQATLLNVWHVVAEKCSFAGNKRWAFKNFQQDIAGEFLILVLDHFSVQVPLIRVKMSESCDVVMTMVSRGMSRFDE